MILDSYYFTNRGGRRENEDSVAVYEKHGGGIFVVADGLGGHMYGKQASECVAATLTEAWKNSEPAEIKELGDWLSQQVSEANQALLEKQEQTRSNMKSTVAVLAFSAIGRAAWANTGDSRLYHIRGDKLCGITEDHSVAYKKYKAGEISRAQIATDEDQSCLLKALGNQRRWEPDVTEIDLESGDAFMLCSDGMWEYLSDHEVLTDCLKAANAKQWAELLLLRVMGRVMPGNDNLTVLTVKLEESCYEPECLP